MVTFWSNRMRRVARVESEVDRFDAQKGARRSVHVDLTPLLLKGGRYYGSISIYDKSMDQTSGTETRFDVLARCFSVDVKGEAAPPYYVHPSSWSFTP
jgi:hypothetical protein